MRTKAILVAIEHKSNLVMMTAGVSSLVLEFYKLFESFFVMH